LESIHLPIYQLKHEKHVQINKLKILFAMLNFNLEPEMEKKLKQILASYSNQNLFFNNAIQYQINELKKEIVNIESDLKEFELKYDVSSEDFYAQYKRGEKGDDEDVMIWAGIFEMQLKSKKQLETLL